MKKFMFTSLVVVFIALAIPATAFAGGIEDGKVVFGGDYILESGEVLDGDLGVLGGSVTLEEGSLVEGTVFVVGGAVFAAGEIEGDLAIIGGNVRFGKNAVVGGDLVKFGGSANTSSVQIGGEVITEQEFNIPSTVNLMTPDWDWNTRFVPTQPFRYSWATNIIGYLFKTLMLAALAVLVMMFLPKNTKLVADTVVSQPVLAGALGLLTAFVAPILIFFLLISICFTIVGIGAMAVLAAAWVFGIIAMGLEVGTRLSAATDQDFQPVVAAGLGTLIVGLVVFAPGLIPCVGWVLSFLLGIIGTGAVLMTRFGRHEYGVEAVPAEQPKLPAKKAAPAKKTSSTAKKSGSTSKKK